MSVPTPGRTPDVLPTPCGVDGCPFLAFPDGTGALVVLAYGRVVLFVCADCRRALELGRPPGTSGRAAIAGGGETRVFNLSYPEATA